MADRKITDLTALTTPASADVLPIVDVSEAAAADKNKKITVGELFKGVPDGTAAAPAIAFESDDGNGIFLSTTDTVGIATNGSSRMTVSTTAVTSTLPVIVPDGTAAAPSVAFTGSGTDTGVYSPGVDQVAISTGGTARLYINSSGQVGVGTTSPSTTALLDVDGKIAAVEGSASEPALHCRNDTNTGINFVGADRLSLVTAGDNRLFINSAGSVGIGTTSPSATLQVSPSSGSANFQVSRGSKGLQINQDSDSADPNINAIGTTAIKFLRDGSESARFDTSGRLLVGTSTSTNNIRLNQKLAIVEAGAGVFPGTAITAYSGTSAAAAPVIDFNRSRGTSDGSMTLVANNDYLGFIAFAGADGTNFAQGAYIAAQVDGTPGAGDMPGRLVFATSADASANPTERMRITSEGILSNKSSLQGSISGAGWSLSQNGDGYFLITRDGSVPVYINRLSADGDLINFYQDGIGEGSISVSGTTVSYNGAHLARWSQLPGGVERTEILRGSVLSNIDEMCEWGDEDNEQLNRMKVSDVEGDKNVAGVFQAWDDEDDTFTNDFYCAMTGDFVIRIAQGVTVERGDLLMSAGDGTAKPQDDDIIRSKTVAKVTSTHVSETYADGSYCVPCVLMAC